MEVIQAGSAGFCFGVARAVKMARELADTASSPRMLGSVIHNRHVTSALEQRGMRELSSPDQARAGDSVLLRAHGAGKDTYRELEQRGAQVIDATCPRVAHVAAGDDRRSGTPGGAGRCRLVPQPAGIFRGGRDCQMG